MALSRWRGPEVAINFFKCGSDSRRKAEGLGHGRDRAYVDRVGGGPAGSPSHRRHLLFLGDDCTGDLEPVPDVRLQLPDQPTQLDDLGNGFTISNVATTGTSQYGPVSYDADYSFYTGTGLNAGFDDGTAYHSYFSQQLFAGPTSAPTFKTGSHSLYDDPTGPVVATLVISDGSKAGAVPEPVSWAMMIVGFGVIGAVGRRGRLKTPAYGFEGLALG